MRALTHAGTLRATYALHPRQPALCPRAAGARHVATTTADDSAVAAGVCMRRCLGWAMVTPRQGPWLASMMGVPLLGRWLHADVIRADEPNKKRRAKRDTCVTICSSAGVAHLRAYACDALPGSLTAAAACQHCLASPPPLGGKVSYLAPNRRPVIAISICHSLAQGAQN